MKHLHNMSCFLCSVVWPLPLVTISAEVPQTLALYGKSLPHTTGKIIPVGHIRIKLAYRKIGGALDLTLISITENWPYSKKMRVPWCSGLHS